MRGIRTSEGRPVRPRFEKLLLIKIQLFVAVVVSIPLIITGIIYHGQIRDLIVEQFTEMNQKLAREVSTSLDLVIDNIVDVSKQTYKDALLESIMAKETHRYDDLAYVSARLNQIKHSNEYTHSVLLYMEKSRRIMSTEYGYAAIDAFREDLFLDWYDQGSTNFDVLDTHPIDSSVSDVTAHVFSVCTRLPIEAARNFKGALIINVDQDAVCRRIITPLCPDETASFFVLNSVMEIIIAEDRGRLYQGMGEVDASMGSTFESTMPAVPPAHGYRPWACKQLVVREHLKRGDWSLVSFYPLEPIRRSVCLLRGVFLMVGSLLTVLILVVCTALVYRLMKPLEDLCVFIRSNHSGAAGRLRHLRDINKAVIRIFRDREEAERKLTLTVPVYKERFLYRLVQGELAAQRRVLEGLSVFGIDIPEDHLLVSLLQIDDFERAAGSGIQTESTVTFMARSVADSYFSRSGLKHFSVEMEPGRLVVVFQAEELKMSDVLNRLQELQDHVRHRAGLSITVALCDIEVGLANLSAGYEKAREVLKYKILFGSGKILLHSDIQQEQNRPYHYPYDKEELLKSYVRVGSRAKALQTLEGIFEELRTYHDYSHARQAIIELDTVLFNLCHECNIQLGASYRPEVLLNKLLSSEAIAEIQRYFNDKIARMTRTIQGNRTSSMQRHFMRLDLYLRDNYALKDLTLELTAETMRLSPTYINQILKQHTGKTFVQLLHDIRIQKACELIKDERIKVKEIADRVGFSSSKYFIKVYREMMGVTPGRHRQAVSVGA